MRIREFLLKNCLPTIVFLSAFYGWGARPAIASALVVAALQMGWHLGRREKLPPFMVSGAFFTALTGSLDLISREPRWFRFEPFLQNVTGGTVLLLAIATRLPVARWYIEGLPARFRPQALDPATERSALWVWVAYFYLKAGLYFWVALKVDLGHLALIRAVFGPVSGALLLVAQLALLSRFRKR